MPRKAMRRPRRNMAKKARVAKRGASNARNLSPGNQFAKIVETVEFPDLKANRGDHALFNLGQFFRATTIAKNFQFYRAKTVKWEYMPLYNTFRIL